MLPPIRVPRKNRSQKRKEINLEKVIETIKEEKAGLALVKKNQPKNPPHYVFIFFFWLISRLKATEHVIGIQKWIKGLHFS